MQTLQSNRLVQIYYLVKKLRHKYGDDRNLRDNETLNRIVWHSLPVVYGVIYGKDWYTQWKAVGRATRSRKQKKWRANKYIDGMRDRYDQLYFVSLTFNDCILENTTEQTRHRYAQRWCNEYCRDYFANQDFGKTNLRPHYHAVVALKAEVVQQYAEYSYLRQKAKKDGLQWRDEECRYGWQYGFSHIKPINMRFDDENCRKNANGKITGYMLKLANHSGKLGTGKSFHKRGMKDVDNLPF